MERVCHRVCGKLEPAPSRFRFFVLHALCQSRKSGIKPCLQEDRLSPRRRFCRVALCRHFTGGRPWSTGRNTKNQDLTPAVTLSFAVLCVFARYSLFSLARSLRSLKPQGSLRDAFGFSSSPYVPLSFARGTSFLCTAARVLAHHKGLCNRLKE